MPILQQARSRHLRDARIGSPVCHDEVTAEGRPTMRNDIEFNIQFVKTVENYPNLWNSSLESYSNRVESEKSWRAIGETFGESQEACQEKWRILRGSFSRSYKHKMEGNTNRKEYYLSKHMQFLIPYMKTTKKPKPTPTQSQEVEVLPDQYMTFKFEDTEDYQSDTTSQVDTSTIFEESTGDLTKDSFEQVSIENDIKKRKRCSSSRTEETDDSDLLFLKSILPEMKALEGKKKNIFKIKVLNTLAELLYASSEEITPATSSTGEAFKNCTDSGLIYTKL